MLTLNKLSKSETKKVVAGRKVVEYIDWDNDGIKDKVTTTWRNGVVVKRTVKYGRANQ